MAASPAYDSHEETLYNRAAIVRVGLKSDEAETRHTSTQSAIGARRIDETRKGRCRKSFREVHTGYGLGILCALTARHEYHVSLADICIAILKKEHLVDPIFLES
jgi:hypothetical protein